MKFFRVLQILSQPVTPWLCALIDAHCIEKVYVRRKLSQFVSNHVLRYCDIIVLLAVVDLELQTDKVWQDCSGACLCLDGSLSLTGLHSCNGEALDVQSSNSEGSTGCLTGGCWGLKTSLALSHAL